MTKTIQVEVDKDGKLTIKQGGISGAACLKDWAKIVASLKENGVELPKQDQTKTADYYKTTTTVKQTVGS